MTIDWDEVALYDKAVWDMTMAVPYQVITKWEQESIKECIKEQGYLLYSNNVIIPELLLCE